MRRRHQSDKPKSLLLFHLVKASSVPFFDWEGFHATHELSVDEASLFFDADDCGFVSWRHGALISRVGQGQNTFLGECTPTGAENKPPAWILDLRRSKRHLRGALH